MKFQDGQLVLEEPVKARYQGRVFLVHDVEDLILWRIWFAVAPTMDLLNDARAAAYKILRASSSVKPTRRIRYSGPPRVGYVYWLRDGSGRLLYVGKTWSIEQRMYGSGGHAETKSWWPEVARIDVREYRTEQDALAAEAVQIARLLPPKNITIPRNPPARAPRAVRRFTETPRQVSP